MRAVRFPGKVVTVACVVALSVTGAAAALGALTTGDRPAAPRTQAAEVTVAVTAEAQSELRRLKSAGLPVEHEATLTPATDPDHLLGRADGYRSKVSFEDDRVDGGLVADNDPGSVALGGVIEVFADAEAARERAQRLQDEAVGIPARAERGYLSGRVLLRLSPYLDETHAERYREALGADPVPTSGPAPDVREV
ncbi:hypothetical protein QNO07_18425 [Streptomyces sp. 549]|uniref:hypothetical protein n=1 Tax=Streptomyces sp. 549 TaxID=3049076 RepID=UPI0024C2B458|nr:hypothetical protein [Streptomyces sp. 549]MDK1475370.1 hypothetical protein [Streptomyces sp. 549]